MKKIIFNLSLRISNLFHLEQWILGSTSGPHKYIFFVGWGPKMLIVKNEKVSSLGGMFEIICEFNDKNELTSCLPKFLDTQKSDLVFYGKKVFDAYQKYSLKSDKESVGMTFVC